ncbi:TPA: exosome complex RNA-binding protein Csl4 [Candidatus Micrarchaeota archaeon]|nr:exosome complex RNA-binding protein Csl4 [Candidatus Micrarchaeota archaeon]
MDKTHDSRPELQDTKPSKRETGKLVEPGTYLAGAEEVLPGRGTFSENDEIFAATFGHVASTSKDAIVDSKKRILKIIVGTDVYGIVTNVMDSKALLQIIPLSDDKDARFPPSETAVLKVSSISPSFIRDIRDGIRIGDIVRAKVFSTRDGMEISMRESTEYGVIKAFCSRCRHNMILKSGGRLMCSSCGWMESRKISKFYSLKE